MERDAEVGSRRGSNSVFLNETQSGDIPLCRLSLWVTLGACQPKASDTLYAFTATIRFSIISKQRSGGENMFIYLLSVHDVFCFSAQHAP